MFKFIENSRALVIDGFLVIADLHIGYEKILSIRGYNIPKQIKNFFEQIKELKVKTGVKNLIILGDIKHNVPKIAVEEKYDVPNFFHELSKIFEKIIVIKGNHDGLLERMVHEPNVEIVREKIIEDTGFIHGHTKPSNELMLCKTIIMGHVHPSFKFVDALGARHNYPCWIIGKLNPKKLKGYEKIECEKVVVVPAFNKFFSGYGKFVGPLAKALKLNEIYLLDLTKVK
jgi:putative SbcD/Mre11-related phosphoesterase